MGNLFEKYFEAVRKAEPIRYAGHVFRVQGLLIESRGPRSVIGELCVLEVRGRELAAEVVGLDGTVVRLMAYGPTAGVETGTRVIATGAPLSVACSPALLGRILGPLGVPVDGGKPVQAAERYPVLAGAPPPLKRPVITKQVVTGIRAIDGLLACGEGQRLGVFAGSGVGKSTFQGMIARNTSADVNVIALIGERGRELNDFIKNSLGEEGLKRSVVVMASSDESAIARLRGAYVATAVAEYFRDLGKSVMFLFDSVTRFARAQREISLAAGEPVAQRGYTPSVFDALPKLLERTGTNERGAITAFYTVLVDGDDLDEPVSDNVRGILDGHIVLSRALAERGHYPAIDVLKSISRLAGAVSVEASQRAALVVRRLMAVYAEAEDIINAGAYREGSNPEIDAAIAKRPEIENFLIQSVEDKSPLEQTLSALAEISGVEIEGAAAPGREGE